MPIIINFCNIFASYGLRGLLLFEFKHALTEISRSGCDHIIHGADDQISHNYWHMRAYYAHFEPSPIALFLSAISQPCTIKRVHFYKILLTFVRSYLWKAPTEFHQILQE